MKACVCVCVCVCVCAYACVHVCVCACEFARANFLGNMHLQTEHSQSAERKKEEEGGETNPTHEKTSGENHEPPFHHPHPFDHRKFAVSIFAIFAKHCPLTRTFQRLIDSRARCK